MPDKKMQPDFMLLAATIGLLSVGLMMVYSASAVIAKTDFHDPFYFFKRQFLFASVGLILMIFIMNVHYSIWKEWAKWLVFICFLLLIAVLIPGIGQVHGGARSWLGIGAFSVQPSEFMKIALIFFLARFLSDHQKHITTIKKGLLPSFALVFLAFGLIMLQPDLGTGTVMVITCTLMIFAAGARIRHFVFMGLMGAGGFAALVLSAPYRMERIISFLDPWQDPKGSGFQIIQSLYAIGPGGLLGFGLGESRQKFQYLPEPQTDFIFAIISEELGLIGATFVILLFCVLLWRGLRTALHAPDLYGSLLSVGIIAMIAVQVMINIAVVTGMMPVTGITLPFLSYGGSSLTLMLISLGVLLNISRYANY